MFQSFSSRNQIPEDDDDWDDIYTGPYDDPYDAPRDDPYSDPYGCFMDDDAVEMKCGSAMDCTGLIPSLPRSRDELDSYSEMYRYPGNIPED